MTDALKTGQEKGTAEGAPDVTPIMAAPKGTALDALVGPDEKGPDTTLKLRLVFKGPVLDDVLKVLGAKVKDGARLKSFVVPGTQGDKEVGDVL